MRNAFIENIVRPLISRLGTVAASVLLSYGYASQNVQPFIDAVSVVLLLGVDLLLSRYYRQLAVKGGTDAR